MMPSRFCGPISGEGVGKPIQFVGGHAPVAVFINRAHHAMNCMAASS
jgi:hypothetical protein